MTEQEKLEDRRKKQNERKRRERARKKKLGMGPAAFQLSRGERLMSAVNALAREFEDETEYVFSLIMADRKRLESEGCDLSRFEEIVKARPSHSEKKKPD